MPFPRDEPWLDDAAGRLVRPYALTNGRTEPSTPLNLLSMVMATGGLVHTQLDVEYVQAIELCRIPISVAEVAARLRQPVMVAKVLLADLIGWGALTNHAPDDTTDAVERQSLLKAVLDGLNAL